MLSDLFLQINTLPWFQYVAFGTVSKLLLVLAFISIIWGLLRLLRRKKSASKGIRAIGYGIILALLTLGFLLVDSQLNRYPVLLPEREILEISFSRNPAENAAQSPYIVHMQSVGPLSDGTRLDQKWPIQGGQWRLTSRVLLMPGLQPRARLHRLITRDEAMQPADEPQRAYVLNDNESPDLWRLLHRKLATEAEMTRITTTEFLPVKPGERYRIALTDSEIRLRLQDASGQTQ